MAAGMARNPAKPKIGQGVLQRIVQPGQQNDGKNAQDKKVRPILFHSLRTRYRPLIVVNSDAPYVRVSS